MPMMPRGAAQQVAQRQRSRQTDRHGAAQGAVPHEGVASECGSLCDQGRRQQGPCCHVAGAWPRWPSGCRMNSGPVVPVGTGQTTSARCVAALRA